MKLPAKCVVDTNVATTSNGANDDASPACVAACAKAIQRVMKKGEVFIDDGNRIVDEYRKNLHAQGQPGPGDVFFKWLLTNEWSGKRVSRVPITERPGDPDDFEELPEASEYDPSDRKFLAVAAAATSRPHVLQALDSKWWGWKESLQARGVTLHFLCPDELKAKHAQKMGS